MFIDSLLLYGLTKELRASLLFSQVREIHQTDARVLVLELYRPAGTPVLLTLSAQNPPAIFAAPLSGKRGGYLDAGNFCMLLRKQLEGSRLSDVEQLHLDRVVRLSFDRIETDGEIVTRELYLELIPSSPNLVLVENGRVTSALVHGKKQHRELSAQSVYTLPEGGDRMDFMDFSAEELLELFRAKIGQGLTLKDFLFASFNGLSSSLVSRLLSERSLPEDTALDALSPETLSAICAALATLAENIRTAEGLTLYRENGKEIAQLLPLPDKEGERLPSISAYLAKAAAQKGDAVSASVLELKRRLRSLIKKEERKERKISEELAETKQAETYKLWGNLLTINAYKKIPGAKSVTVDNPFDPEGREETIPLSPEMDLIRNAQAYFKRYSKMKTRAAIGEEKREECLLKLAYLRDAEYFADEIKTRDALTALTEELREAGLGRYEKQKKKPTAKKKPRGGRAPPFQSGWLHRPYRAKQPAK